MPRLVNTAKNKILEITDIKLNGKSILAEIIDFTIDEDIKKLTLQPGQSFEVAGIEGEIEMWWLESYGKNNTHS